MAYSLEERLGRCCENEGFGLPYRKVSLCRAVLEGWLGGYSSDPGKR